MKSLKTFTVSDLRRELARREKGAGKLQKQHANLASQLAALEAELADLGVDAASARRGRKPGSMAKRGLGRPKGSKNRGPGRPKGSKNKRANNAMSLVEAILKGVRAGSTVSPAEAGAAARKVGYKSSSPNFGMMVAKYPRTSPVHVQRRPALNSPFGNATLSLPPQARRVAR